MTPSVICDTVPTGGICHDVFRSYVPGPLTFADPPHLPLEEAEIHVHDVMNVFMCTGYTRDTHQYFMKASPVRPGDFIEFFAEIDLLVALSACPGGDCGAGHSDDTAKCVPLK
jgi:hypothetical protein